VGNAHKKLDIDLAQSGGMANQESTIPLSNLQNQSTQPRVGEAAASTGEVTQFTQRTHAISHGSPSPATSVTRSLVHHLHQLWRLHLSSPVRVRIGRPYLREFSPARGSTLS
jgi:hypothetical protein